MLAFYPYIKSVHLWCVALSGLLFAMRGIGVLLGARWPMRLSVRLISYAIDTTLLTAALMLVVALPSGVFANGWLAVKLALLVAYVVLGSFALKRASTRGGRAMCFAAAVAVFLFVVSIARAHDPVGALRIVFG